jgi:hypothetical protein
MTLTSGSANATSVWNGNIPASAPSNATITWSVTATDGTFSKSQIGASYSDEPTFGIVATASASIPSTCSGTPTDLSVIFSFTGAAPATPAPSAVSSPTADEDIGNVKITF